MTRRGYLVKGESVLKKQLSEETAEKKQERLAKRRASDKKQLSEETAEKKQERRAKRRANYKKNCRKKVLIKSKKGLQKGERIIKNKPLSNQ